MKEAEVGLPTTFPDYEYGNRVRLGNDWGTALEMQGKHPGKRRKQKLNAYLRILWIAYAVTGESDAERISPIGPSSGDSLQSLIPTVNVEFTPPPRPTMISAYCLSNDWSVDNAAAEFIRCLSVCSFLLHSRPWLLPSQ